MTSFDAFHIGDQLISKVQAQGVKDAEVFAEEIIATHIRAFDGKIESTRAISTQGIGLRVIVDGRRGYSFASTVSTEQLADLAERAISRDHLTQPDSANQFPDAQATDELPGIFHYHMSEIPIEQKIELALATER